MHQTIRPSTSAGAALIIVLAFLVLISVMVVAFFTSVTTETGAVKAQADGMAARQLADSTAQYIISQIRQATSGGTSMTWATQPGLVRTYDSSGNAGRIFKLYSSSQMITDSSTAYNPASDLPGSSWMNEKALWTDLNSPVIGGGGEVAFPIIDPRAAAAPPGKNSSLVEGFSYNADSIAGAQAPADIEDKEARVPMPVRWLYQLKDGRFTAPSGGDSSRADFSASDPKPTASNPIVGRVAFWSDDETSKLNLNTAVGGPAWDIPTYTAGIDLHFSRYKPVKDEFARYPGHPASTSLLPVLWSFGGVPSPETSLFPTLNPPVPYRYLSPGYTEAAVKSADVTPTLSPAAEAFFQKALALNPRNMWGGSEMGSKATVLNVNQQPEANPLDGDRLFASVDEAFYSMPDATTENRPPNAFALTDSDVAMLDFFFTTHSRAPDLNPRNQPRVGIWPIPQLPAKRTPIDKLIAFCSTLGPPGNESTYYFTRNNPDSTTADFLPGSRNDQVFDYLQRSLQQRIPGFGGSIGTRYGVDGTTRILTLIYDYIRGSTNLTDTFDAEFVSRHILTAPYAFVPPRVGHAERGKGQVIPIRIAKNGETYKGLGRFVTIKQVALQFIAVAANQPPAMIDSVTGAPTTTQNPMHPWVADPPAQIDITDNGDGTWDLGATNAYPTIAGQTHAGLPLLTNKWVQDQALFAAGTGPGSPLTGVINPRYQGPAAIYGTGGDAGAANSALLPEPAPVAMAGKLAPHQTLIQAAFLVDPVIVNPGTPPYSGKYQVRVRGLDAFTADGKSLGFPADIIQVPTRVSSESIDYGASHITVSTQVRSSVTSSLTEKLAFVSAPVIVGPGETFNFGGGIVTIEIRTEPTSGNPTLPSNLGELIQTFQIEFPSATNTASGPFPTPLLPPMPIQGNTTADTPSAPSVGTWFLAANKPLSAAYRTTGIPAEIQDLAPSIVLTFDGSSPLSANPNFGVGQAVYMPGFARTKYGSGASTFAQNYILPERMTDPAVDERAKLPADTVRSIELLYGDARVAGTQAVVGTGFFRPHRYYHDPAMRGAHTLRFGDGAANFLGATDHLLSDAATLAPSSGFAYIANHTSNDYTNYRGVPASSSPRIKALGAQLSRSLRSDAGPIRSGAPHVTSSVDFDDSIFTAIWRQGGDFDTGPGLTLDGPFIGKTNEGGEALRWTTQGAYDGRNTNPDFNIETFDFSLENLNNAPNRQIPSAVIFGSLPVGNSPATSWRTLLFSPNPNSQNHAALGEVAPAGAPPLPGKAPDSLLLDFFHMPVVEPYAISEPFSTAGRVNMNYQIAPFTYIRRDTALRGVLRSGILNAVEDRRVQNRKMRGIQGLYHDDATGGIYSQYLRDTGHWAFRYPIHLEETLKQFEQRFAAGDLFRAPSEICSLWLYPAQQPTATNPENSAKALVNWDANSSNIKSWWYDNPGTTRKSVTSDNMRERPYATIYPRLTTKSNTFTAYFKVQVLQKSPQTRADEWVEGRDQVRSEYRGSATIERYIDPSDPSLPDFTLSENADVSLDDFYRFRVMNAKRFAP
jgi:uncharacterized protein (TIGR02600 family)